jgi:hypothetical protein
MRPILLLLALLASPAVAQTPAAPPPSCAADPMFRQQDFTIGSWDVSRNGQKNAEVHMERVLGGCAIQEHWMVPAGKNGAGIGLFTYSRVLRAWTYAWAADTGAATMFTGQALSPTEIRYDTERALPNGGKRVRHWTLSLLPDGRIRELSVGSDDNGATWTTEYELFWTKHAA